MTLSDFLFTSAGLGWLVVLIVLLAFLYSRTVHGWAEAALVWASATLAGLQDDPRHRGAHGDALLTALAEHLRTPPTVSWVPARLQRVSNRARFRLLVAVARWCGLTTRSYQRTADTGRVLAVFLERTPHAGDDLLGSLVAADLEASHAAPSRQLVSARS